MCFGHAILIIAPIYPDLDGQCPAKQFKNNIATTASGSWESDTLLRCLPCISRILHRIAENEQDYFDCHKSLAGDAAGFIGRSEQEFGCQDTPSKEDAMLQYGEHQQYDVTEYEAYYSFIFYFYPDRVAAISLPYVIRQPKLCTYYDTSIMSAFHDSEVSYFTCHDRYDREDFYINCKAKKCRTV
jgi:hypothetical protein